MDYDILLINAERDFCSLGRGGMSLSLNSLAVFLKENGYRVALFHGFPHDAINWIDNIMQKKGANSAGFYCDYENISLVEELCRKIKEKWNIPLFVGGPQTIALDEDFLLKSQGC